MFVSEPSGFCLFSTDGYTASVTDVPELNSSHEEADTRINLHSLTIASTSPQHIVIIVRSPDTDVFILVFKFALDHDIDQRVLFDTGNGNKWRLIDMKGVNGDIGDDMCSAMPALHAFSGCDKISAFVIQGEILAENLLIQHQ
jgi:hypothetical protein